MEKKMFCFTKADLGSLQIIIANSWPGETFCYYLQK